MRGPAPSEAGQRVRCDHADGYAFTVGKEYTILEYTPRTPSGYGFSFPAYVEVKDDYGRTAYCHAYRFEVIQ